MKYTGQIVANLLDKMVLAYGSIMLLYCRQWKKDPKDETLAINACIVTPANIDFDGKYTLCITICTNHCRHEVKNLTVE